MKIDESIPVSIKSWSPEDRPREKLLSKGLHVLTDAELVAILIGSGTPRFSAVEIARRTLMQVRNNLGELAKLSVNDLMKVKGIGEARAITIVAAMELGRRRKELDPELKSKISSSRDAYEQFSGEMMDLGHEEFWVLLLNRAHRVMRKKKISEGGVSATIADPKIIFKSALEELASGVIVAHNHPSGNMKASQSDIDLTRKLKEAGTFLEIQLLDHIIICGQKYFSFADEGML